MPFLYRAINASIESPPFDGKIFIGGSFTTANSVSVQRFSKLNADGSSASGFSTNISSTYGTIYKIAVQSDGKVIVGGAADLSYPGYIYNYGIARLNTDGTIDTSFRSGGGFYDIVWDIIPLSNGKILTAGEVYPSVRRLNSDGSVDSSLSPNISGTATCLSIQNDNKILVGGNFDTAYNYASVSLWSALRINTNDTLDTSFLVQKGVNTTVYKIFELNGTVFLFGDFTQANNNALSPSTVYTVYRLMTYSSTTGYMVAPSSSTQSLAGVNGNVYAADYDDSKIIIGGDFTTCLNSYWSTIASNNRIVRINQSNGYIDSTFNIGTGFNGAVHDIKIQSDGKILVGGAFTTYNNVSRPYLARLESDGSLDTTFTPSLNGEVRTITLTS